MTRELDRALNISRTQNSLFHVCGSAIQPRPRKSYINGGNPRQVSQHHSIPGSVTQHLSPSPNFLIGLETNRRTMLLLRAAIVLTFLVLLPTLRVIRVLSSQQVIWNLQCRSYSSLTVIRSDLQPTPAEAALLESIGKYDDDCCCQSGQKDPPEAESGNKKSIRD